jgi:uncharacterized repeat protein (TIGR01451 family)
MVGALRRTSICLMGLVLLAATPLVSAQNRAINTATITAPAGVTDPDNGNNSATDDDPIVAPSLALTKVHAGDFTVGTNGTYTLTVANTGSAPTSGAITLIDALPAGLGYVSATGTGWTCSANGQDVTCSTNAVLAAGASGNPVTLVVAVAPTAIPSVTNTARISGGGDAACPPAPGAPAAHCGATDPTTVGGSTVLALAKTGPATAEVSTGFSYTLTLTNTGNLASGPSVVVQDQLPAGVVATAASGAACAPLNSAGALLTCTVAGPIAANGGTAAITLAVTAPATIGAITNYASTNVGGAGTPSAPPGAACSSNATVSCANAPTDITLPSAQAFDFCAANTIWNITGTGLGTATATAQSPRYTIGGSEALLPALDKLIPNGSFNGNMVDPVRNRLMFYNRVGSASQLWAYDAGNGGWYVASSFSSVDIPRAGMNQAGIGYLVGGGANPPVYRVTSSSTYGYTVATAGNLTYSATPTDLGSGDIAFDAAGNGWMVVGQDVWKISAASLAANAPVAVRQQRPVLNGTPINFSLAGIAFGSDGRLYVANVGPTPASGYYALDLETSVLTRVANATGARDLASCAFPALAPTVLGVTKTLAQVNGAPYVAGSPVRPGDTLTYGINIAYKSGELAATIFAGDVVDTLPANTAAVTTGNDFTCSGSNCTNTAVRTLQPGGDTTFNFVVKVNDALPANTAAISNAVTVKNVDCAAAGNDCAEVTPIGPIVSVAKTAPATVLAGGVLTYSFTVGNSGATATPVGVVVQDQLPAGVVATSSSGANCVPLPSAPGALLTCTLPAAIAANGAATFTVATTAPATAGDIVNHAATSTSGTGNPGTPPGTGCTSNAATSCTSAPTTVLAPSLSLVKAAGTPVDINGNGLVDAGDTIPYTFVVTNTGNVALNSVVVNDSKLSATPIACVPATVPAGGTANCGPVSYTITTADQTAGQVDNSATAEGTPAGGSPVSSAPSATSTPVTPAAPALTLVKTAGTPVDANGNGITDAGDTIAYTFVATNDGNVPLNGVVVNDSKLSATPIACAPAIVPVGGTANCGPVTYTITSADETAGSVDNSATASGTPPGGSPIISDPSTTSTPVTPAAAALTLVKTAGTPIDTNANGVTDAGDTIAYSFVVTNSGNVPIDGVVINDAKLSATPIACTPATVPVGGTANCGPASYTITGADEATGSVDNSATATGTPPGGTPVTSDPSTTSTPVTAPAAALTLVKSAGAPVDANANGITDAGDTIAYSFVVTNSGNVPLNGVVINDAKLSATPIACTPATVPVGGTANCGPASYTITGADEATGSVDNSATASGTPPGGTPVTSDPSATSTPVTPAAPGLTLVKTAGAPVDTNANGITDAGDTIAYSFVVSNAGNVPVDGVAINDAKLSATPIACTPSTIPVGGTANCGPVSYTITTADEAAGNVTNSATATGTPPSGTPVTSDPSTTSTPVTPAAPALILAKTAGAPVDVNGNGIVDAGDTIAYSFVATNTGNVALNGIVVNDAKISATPIACAPASVPVGGSASCGPVTYTITAVDEAAGSVDNSATATGTPPGGSPVTSDPATTSTPTDTPAPALTVVKTAGTPVDTNANGITDAGDTIAYTFAVTNGGNVPLNGVVVNDAKLSPTPIACTPATVPANGGTADCGPVTYTITAADETAGSVDNTATATGTPPGGTPVTSPPSTTNTPVTPADVALALVKNAGTPVDVNGNGITDAGDTIAYTFAVTNSGNVPLNGVVVNDAKLSATPIACTPAVVPANGGTAACGPVTYTITTADETAGSVDNTATATGTPPGGTPVTSDPSTTSTPVVAPNAALSLVKMAGTPVDANANGITDAGDTIAYTFVATNDGNVPLNGVVVNDSKLSATPIACAPAIVPVGGTANCGPVTYTITSADEAAGGVDNSATASGTPPGGSPIISDPSTTSTPVTPAAAALTLVKTAGTPIDTNANGITDAGDTIAYTFAITNNGNVPLNGVVVNDGKLSATPVACTPATVPANGGTADCGPVTYTITTADETAGSVDNSATATGTPPGGTPVTSPPSTTSTPVTAPAAALTLVKSAGAPVDANANGITDAGDTIAYSFVVTNSGNVPLNGVVVNDSKLSATPVACTPATIPVGGTANCGPASYTITGADEATGSVDNSATATGTPPGGTPVTSDPSTTSTPVTPAAPALTLVKTAGTPVDTNANGITDAGDTIAYSFVATNSGNVPLNGVVINDAKLSATPIACAPSTIPVGGTANCGPVSYIVTDADEASGSVDNSATATGTPPGGTPVTSDPSTTSTPTTVPNAALTLVKTAGAPVDATAKGLTDAGDTIAYSFVVTNSGNVPVDGVVINDAKLSATPIACTPATVPVGGTANCGPVSYTITGADEDTGSVDNSATATGTPPGGTPVTSDPSTTSTPVVAAAPSLMLVKTAGTPVDVNGNGITDAGDTIAYSFAVTNAGNVPVEGVAINDARLSATPIACTPASVPVGGTTECGPLTYAITTADVAAGRVDNSATATGTPPGGTPITSPPSTTSTPVTAPAAELTLVKTAGTPVDVNGNGITDAGDTIAYSFVVTNAGNVPVDGVAVDDAKLSTTPIACTPATVPVGGTAACGPVTYTITAADVGAGSVDNSATATGTPPGGTPVTSPPSTTSTPVTPANAELALVKSAGAPVDVNGNGLTDAGDTIAYSFVVTNSGNVPVDGVVINDAKLSATPIACTPATVPVGGTANCGPLTYAITVADVAAGSVDNSATATGTPPGGAPVTSDPSTTSTPATAAAPSLALVKTAGTPVDVNGNGLVDAGDTIAYSFVATNTGNVALDGVAVDDARVSPTPIACAPATLAPDGIANCGPVTYTITAADVTAGSVDNSATASGTPPGGTPVTSDPSTTSTAVTAPAPSLRSQKQMTGYRDADADGQVSVGDTLTYVITVTNTGNVALIDVTITDARLAPNAVTCGSVAPNATCVLTGTYVVSQGDADGGQIVNTAVVTTQPRPGGPVLPPEACPVGSTDARCAPSTTVPVTQRPGIATSKTATLATDAGTRGVGNVGDVIAYAVTATNTGNVTLFNVGVVDSLEGAAPVALQCAPTTLAPGEVATCQGYTHTITAAEANAGGTLDNAVTASGQTNGGSQPVTVTATGGANVRVEADPTTIRVVKTASPRDVKTGDLVRYTLSIQNTGTADLVDGTVVDTPPPGFNYVDGSLAVADGDAAGRLAGTSPIRVDQLDIAGGERATITYLLRVGAGVRPGFHTNSALVQDDGRTVSNVATADVQMVADPVLDESLVLGTVFDDRDGDGWQDSAAITGLRVQGGFAADAYVPDSTSVVRDGNAAPEADASAPLLHGVALGQLSGRQSEADPVAAHTVIVRQTLKSLAFTDDFALTTKQGVTVRMDAAGKTRIERDGDAAKGLNSADPTVERRVSQVLDGYRVDYVIANAGIDERGIPGVRIASVEGLLVETDQFGRYHLLGIEGGSWERGRNFILKVDPATLPPGTVLTTDNPLLRRVTPGLPVRFDFGAKLPPGLVEGGEQLVEMELGTVTFDPGSATLRASYLPVVDAMAEQVRAHRGGEVLIAADGDSEALAYDRAKAVQAALLDKLTPEQAGELRVSLRTDLADPSSTLLTLGETPVLGTVLFDTDQATIKPQYAAVIDRIAADVARLAGDGDKPVVIGVVGHADSRGSDAYNVALGLRRARAVFDAIAAKLAPEVRSQLRVDISDSPTAPVGIRGQ